MGFIRFGSGSLKNLEKDPDPYPFLESEHPNSEHIGF